MSSTISGTRSVTSARFRVNTRTSSPSRWIWIRAPSSFHSTAAGRIRSKAPRMSSADWASIGCTGVRSERRNRARAALPPSIAAAATAPRSPASIAARRTSASGHLRRARDGVDHHALEGSLADLAHQEPSQEALFLLGRTGEQVVERLPASRLRPGAGESADPAERLVDLDELERRRRAPAEGRRGATPMPTPIDPCGRTPER